MDKIALDPAMYHAEVSVADEARKAADLGYEYLDLSPLAGSTTCAASHTPFTLSDGEGDCFNHRANVSNRDNFDGLATVCVFGWEEHADDIHWRMLKRVATELTA
jgi:hypothetical protein